MVLLSQLVHAYLVANNSTLIVLATILIASLLCFKLLYLRQQLALVKTASSTPSHMETAPMRRLPTLEGRPSPSETVRVKQTYDAFLVLDVEATCLDGAGFHWSADGHASQLEIVDEFRSFVKPTWAPVLSPFCKELTGITQAQVDSAPIFPSVLAACSQFLAKNSLINPVTGEKLVKFCWCSDGPYDVQNFVVKQCFISNIPTPAWLRGDVIDVRKEVIFWSEGRKSGLQRTPRPKPGERRKSMGLPLQLQALDLDSFEGRQHSGIDDARNIARILAELGRRGVCLEPNISIDPRRRWHWMGKKGEILEHVLAWPDS